MDLCLVEERSLGTRVSMRWWEQEDLELVGMRTADREAERVDRDKEEERADMDMDYYVGGYCSNHNTLGTEPNATLAYAPG